MLALFFKIAAIVLVLALLVLGLILDHKRFQKKKKGRRFTNIYLLSTGFLGLCLLAIFSWYMLGGFLSSPKNFNCTYSMSHTEENFELWWEANSEHYSKYGITKSDFLSFPHSKGILCSEEFIPIPAWSFNTKVGDVVSFYLLEENRIIAHRIVSKWQKDGTTYYTLMGDNTEGSSHDSEAKITQESILYKLGPKIPLSRWVRERFGFRYVTSKFA